MSHNHEKNMKLVLASSQQFDWHQHVEVWPNFVPPVTMRKVWNPQNDYYLNLTENLPSSFHNYDNSICWRQFNLIEKCQLKNRGMASFPSCFPCQEGFSKCALVQFSSFSLVWFSRSRTEKIFPFSAAHCLFRLFSTTFCVTLLANQSLLPPASWPVRRVGSPVFMMTGLWVNLHIWNSRVCCLQTGLEFLSCCLWFEKIIYECTSLKGTVAAQREMTLFLVPSHLRRWFRI